MKKHPQRKSAVPPVDLSGKRFGKWLVRKYAGSTRSKHMWLCRCDCGVQRQIPQSNLTAGRSTKCSQCHLYTHGMTGTRIHEAWRTIKKGGRLPKEWQDFDVFRKVVGDPPRTRSWLTRYDLTKPHSAENTVWANSTQLRRIRQQCKEKRVAHDKVLMRIRNAKSRDERNRCIVAARVAGYPISLIRLAAGVSRQRAYAILLNYSGN